MIKTGSAEDKDRYFMYGDEEKENAAGNAIVKVATVCVATLLLIGACVLLFQISTNQDFHDPKLPWQDKYRTYESE